MSDWVNFFGAEVGASAALAGLLFVAISINIERILKFPWLVNRAAITLVLLLGALVNGSLMLWPQGVRTIGFEALAASTLTSFFVAWLSFVGPIGRQNLYFRWLRAVLYQVAALLPVGGAVVLLRTASGSGVVAIAFGSLMAMVFGCINAWVLLVEILR